MLALGGGTYAQPGMAERLRAAGAMVIWLDCPRRNAARALRHHDQSPAVPR